MRFASVVHFLTFKKRSPEVEPEVEAKPDGDAVPQKIDKVSEELKRLKDAIARERAKITLWSKLELPELVRGGERSLRALERQLKALDSRKSLAA